MPLEMSLLVHIKLKSILFNIKYVTLVYGFYVALSYRRIKGVIILEETVGMEKSF